jgi:hypothetical protein
MEIIRLAEGEAAPVNEDCVNVDTLNGDKFGLWANALCGEEMVSLIASTRTFDTREAAEEEGLAWADAQGVQTVYLTFNAPTPGD